MVDFLVQENASKSSQENQITRQKEEDTVAYNKSSEID